MTPDAQDIADRYVACWNERAGERRRTLLTALWTEDATYLDPLMRGEGREGIGALIEGVQARFPGFRFSVKGRPDGHADRVRFSWSLGPESGEGVVEGTDFAVLAGDGRLRAVTGFLDRAPTPAA
jgi:SnoaL-like protein